MALFYCVYICPFCGYFIEESSNGDLIYKEEKYLNLQCTRCRNVEIINITHRQRQNKDILLSTCCHAKVQLWKMDCPSCGQHMITKILSDD